MASSRAVQQPTEKDLYSSSPARPSHHRTQLPRAAKAVPPPVAMGDSGGQRKSLKRTASAAALLTPPGSPEKAQHRSKHHSFDSDDEHDANDTEHEDGAAMELSSPPARGGSRLDEKTRRTLARAEKAMKGPGRYTKMAMKTRLEMSKKRVEREDSMAMFASTSASTGARGRQPKRGPTFVGEQVERMRLDESPPRAQRRTASPKAPRTPEHPSRTLRGAIQAPVTPTRRSPRNKCPPGPIRDSPNNPFISNSPRVAPGGSKPFEEKETMTYIFRGSKAIFKNPVYGGPSTAQLERSRLPTIHPEFSPDLMTAPKLLFPSVNRDDSDLEDAHDLPDLGSSPIPPPVFTGRGRGANKKRRIAGPSRGGGDGDVFGGDAMVQ